MSIDESDLTRQRPDVALQRPDSSKQAAWLVVVDPQNVFTDPTSQWLAPRWEEAAGSIERLVEAFGERVIVTRWVPKAQKHGSWVDYFFQYQFVDRPADHPTFALDERVAALDIAHEVVEPTFGKWGERLRAITGDDPHLVLAGLTTDCCVISTALPAVDSGAFVSVVSDACAGSDDEAQQQALALMGGYMPQLSVCTSDEIIAALGGGSTKG